MTSQTMSFDTNLITIGKQLSKSWIFENFKTAKIGIAEYLNI